MSFLLWRRCIYRIPSEHLIGSIILEEWQGVTLYYLSCNYFFCGVSLHVEYLLALKSHFKYFPSFSLIVTFSQPGWKVTRRIVQAIYVFCFSRILLRVRKVKVDLRNRFNKYFPNFDFIIHVKSRVACVFIILQT